MTTVQLTKKNVPVYTWTCPICQKVIWAIYEAQAQNMATQHQLKHPLSEKSERGK